MRGDGSRTHTFDSRSDPLTWLGLKEAGDQSLKRLHVFMLLRETDGRVLRVARLDALADFERSLSDEWTATEHELVDENAQRPPIRTLPVTPVPDDLWTHVLGRATSRVRFADAELGEAKVAELCLPLRVEDYVLWLQVAIDDVARMQMLERKCDARGEKYDGRDVASKFVYLHDLEELAAEARLHDEPEVLRVLVRLVQLNDEL